MRKPQRRCKRDSEPAKTMRSLATIFWCRFVGIFRFGTYNVADMFSLEDFEGRLNDKTYKAFALIKQRGVAILALGLDGKAPNQGLQGDMKWSSFWGIEAISKIKFEERL